VRRPKIIARRRGRSHEPAVLDIPIAQLYVRRIHPMHAPAGRPAWPGHHHGRRYDDQMLENFRAVVCFDLAKVRCGRRA
jgi:hypothetical protein